MSTASKLLSESKGILRLAPTWVPRSFCRPGRRIKLHPDDYYVLGLVRGGIDERWFSSTTPADNGPGTPPDEGLSYVVSPDGSERATLLDMVSELGADVIGSALWDEYGRWPIYSKFFDNLGPLPHHIHHDDAHAARVGMSGKPEMYFFPAEVNNYGGEFPYTFFGIRPEVTREEIKQCLVNFTKGDNKLLDYSAAYKLALDTGWDVPPGILHAPGSLCTYEPQFASDVYAMYQSVLLGGHCVPPDLLWKNCPPEELGNFDYLMDVIDWDANTDPAFAEKRFMAPKTAVETDDFRLEWICYKSDKVCAQRLTVNPGCTARVPSDRAFGLIMLDGHGTLNGRPLETPSLIRYGQLTNDEYFVTADAARTGVTVVNESETTPLVLLRHMSSK